MNVTLRKSHVFSVAGAMLTGILLVANCKAAIVLTAFITAVLLATHYKRVFVSILIVMTVFIESTFQQVPLLQNQELLNLNGLTNVFIICITLFYIFTAGVRPAYSPCSKWFLLYLCFVVLSVFLSCNLLHSIKSVIRITTAFFLYLMITQLPFDLQGMKRLFKLLLAVSLLPIATGIYQIVCINHFHFSESLRVSGTFKNGQSYSMYLGILLPFLYARCLSHQHTSGFILWGAAFTAGLINLFYTATRIGWGLCACSIVLYNLFTRRYKTLAIILAMAILSLPFTYQFLFDKFGSFFNTPFYRYFSDNLYLNRINAGNFSVSSLHTRVFIWKHMISAAHDNLLLGMGSGTWFPYFSTLTSVNLASHSDYFEVLFGTGAMGLLAYLSFRWHQIRSLLRIVRETSPEHREGQYLFAPALAVFVCLSFVSFTEVWQAYVGVYWTTWIIFAISEKYFTLLSRERGCTCEAK